MSEVIVSPDYRRLYVELKKEVSQAGLFNPTYKFYINTVLILLGCAAPCFVAIVFFPELFVITLLIVPVFYSTVQTHWAYMAHDAAHRQIFRSSRANDIVLLLINAIVGISPSWWMNAHNAHHSYPNDPVKDPNVRVPILTFSSVQGTGKLRRWQAWYYSAIVVLEPLSMRLMSFTYLARDGRWTRRLEVLGMVIYIVTHFGFLLYFLGFWETLVFSVIHQTCLGIYLGMVFAPNHKGMEVIEDSDKVPFLERQLRTTRNVRLSFWPNWLFMGGLNDQIEHHLFPNLPRSSLWRARTIVRSFCAKHGLPYYEVTLLQSLSEIFHFLDTAGKGKPDMVIVKAER